jgi:hypothetical protein
MPSRSPQCHDLPTEFHKFLPNGSKVNKETDGQTSRMVINPIQNLCLWPIESRWIWKIKIHS